MIRYYVYNPRESLYVACISVKTRAKMKEVLFELKLAMRCSDLFAQTTSVARAGFKDNESGRYWIKHTQYGAKYRCKVCGKKNTGLGIYNHHSYCPLKDPQLDNRW